MSAQGEARLVALAQGLFSRTGHEAHALLAEAWPAPAKVSAQGLRVLKDTLSKGAVLWLCRRGAAEERVWERGAAPPLHFGAETVALLQWLLEQPLAHEAVTPLRVESVESAGAELVLLAAVASSIGTPVEAHLVSQPAVARSTLCALSFPIPVALASRRVDRRPLALTGVAERLLAGLQAGLASWWRSAERLRARLLLPQDVLHCAQAQRAVLDELLGWAEREDKKERCTFLLDALAPLLGPKASAKDFVAPFDEQQPLRQRQLARVAAATTLSAVRRLSQWDEAARQVRFIDDGYDAAQARVKRYEELFGKARFATAQRVLEELEALPS